MGSSGLCCYEPGDRLSYPHRHSRLVIKVTAARLWLVNSVVLFNVYRTHVKVLTLLDLPPTVMQEARLNHGCRPTVPDSFFSSRNCCYRCCCCCYCWCWNWCSCAKKRGVTCCFRRSLLPMSTMVGAVVSRLCISSSSPVHAHESYPIATARSWPGDRRPARKQLL